MKDIVRLVLGCAWFVCSALSAADAGYRIDFAKKSVTAKKNSIADWQYKGKPGTADAVFSVVRLDGVNVLRAEAVNGSGTMLFDLSSVDFKKYPVMRWKWRVDVLPEGADGRVEEKDDQAIGIYVGAGRWSTTSVAYRWETETPKKAEGSATYGLGMVSVKWFSVRNKEDKTGVWQVDECNIYQALNSIFKGNIPKKNLALSISCNSQYTGTKALAYLEYVEFLPASAANKKK